MPLSEYEQRVLEQMERQLASDDPRLANTLTQRGRRPVLRYVLAGVGVAVGLLLLVLGAATDRPVLGVFRSAVAAGDPHEVCRVAHRLAGAMENLRAEQAVTAARRLETMGRSGDLTAAAAAARADLETEVERLIAALKLLVARSRGG